MILGRQHDVWVACRLVLPDKLARQFNQFGVVIAAQRLVSSDRHGRDRRLETRCLIGSAGQGRGKCAHSGKADHIG